MTIERLQTIERELGALRSSVRRWKATSTLLIIGAGLLAASAYGPTPNHLTVKRLDIIADDGTSVLSFMNSDSGGRIDLYNQSGTNMLRLSSTDDGGDFAVWNSSGENVAGIWSTENGGSFSLWNSGGDVVSKLAEGGLTLSGSNASLQIQNKRGKTVAVVASDSDGNGRFQVADVEGMVISEMRMIPGVGGGVIVMTTSGKEMGVLAATSKGGRLNLKNQQGVSVFVASGKEENAGGAMRIANERGVPILILNADDSQRGLIEVRDEDGKGVRRLHPLRGYSP